MTEWRYAAGTDQQYIVNAQGEIRRREGDELVVTQTDRHGRSYVLLRVEEDGEAPVRMNVRDILLRAFDRDVADAWEREVGQAPRSPWDAPGRRPVDSPPIPTSWLDELLPEIEPHHQGREAT